MSESAASSHRVEWRLRTMDFIIARLTGTLADKEALVDMILAGFQQAHEEGISDALYVTENIEKAVVGEQQRAASAIARALRELIKRNAALKD